MSDRESRLDALLAREEIREVVLSLARGTDRLDAPLIRSCYHADAIDDHNSFRGGPEAFASWVLEALAYFEATMHFVGPPRIELAGDRAAVETYCVAHHITRPDAAGEQRDIVLGLRYLDRFERRPQAAGGMLWRIAKRVCAFDWTRTVQSLPEERFRFEEDFTLGRRDAGDASYELSASL